jgi:HEAT repeat protein
MASKMSAGKQTILRGALALAVALAAWLAPARLGRGMLVIMDNGMITDPQEKAALGGAIDSLKANPSDLVALEAVLKALPLVSHNAGISVFLETKDPLKTQAIKLIQAHYSVAVLAQTLANGSDLAAQWACVKVIVQGNNGDNKDVQACGGVIDAGAKAKLKVLVLGVLQRKDAGARAAAVQALSTVLAKEELAPVAKGLMADQDAPVRAAAIYQLGTNGIFDAEVDQGVQKALTESNDPQVLEASCQWWWLVREHHEKSLTPEQEALMVRRSTDSHTEVRRQVALAVAEYATTEHPALVQMLVGMADGDTDEYTRSSAVFSLRNVRTRAMHEKLMAWSKDDKSKPVRDAADRLLKEYNWSYPFMKD